MTSSVCVNGRKEACFVTSTLPLLCLSAANAANLTLLAFTHFSASHGPIFAFVSLVKLFPLQQVLKNEVCKSKQFYSGIHFMLSKLHQRQASAVKLFN